MEDATFVTRVEGSSVEHASRDHHEGYEASQTGISLEQET